MLKDAARRFMEDKQPLDKLRELFEAAIAEE